MKKLIVVVLLILIVKCNIQYPIEAWPNGEIPYIISPAFSLDNTKEKIRKAMDDWESGCNIKFIDISSLSRKEREGINYVRIRPDSRNHSQTGSNWPEMNIIDGSAYYTILHELGHVIGLIHEHQRSDRDTFVKISWEEIRESAKDEFEIRDNPLYIEEDFTFDYDSVMLYDSYSFDINGNPTIVTIDDQRIYVNRRISELDYDHCRAIYNQE